MKVLIIEDNNDIATKLKSHFLAIAEFNEVQACASGKQVISVIDRFAPDLVLISPAKAKTLNDMQLQLTAKATDVTKTLTLNNEKPIPPKRTHIISKSHHGVELVAIANIDYFQAEHKYVIAVDDRNNNFLIDDTLNSLEQEFADLFIRIHRKTLVAKNKIKALERNPNDSWSLILNSNQAKFAISRRQLSAVRNFLKTRG